MSSARKIKDSYICSLLLSHDLIGGKWKMRILWHIIQGDNRFSLLEKGIPDITQKVLSSQLRELEASGILSKRVIKEQPPKTIIYEINEKYHELIPIVNQICDFSLHYAKEHDILIQEEKNEKCCL